jgi:predicted transcriptional regulator
MHKTMIYLDEDLWRAVRERARRERRSAASVVRDAIGRFVELPRRPKRLSFIGAVDGPAGDTARRADELLRGLLR